MRKSNTENAQDSFSDLLEQLQVSDPEAPSGAQLAVVRGQGLKKLREESGKRLEDIAFAARQWGLPWTGATVANIELGRRRLSEEEIYLLPFVLKRAGVGPAGGREYVRLADLFPENGMIAVTPQTDIDASFIRAVLRGQQPPATNDLESDLFNTPEQRRAKKNIQRRLANPAEVCKMSKRYQKSLQRDALFRYLNTSPGRAQSLITQATAIEKGEAEIKAARKLDVKPHFIALAALLKWDHSLTEERDHLLAEQVTSDTSPRTVQALRGHITRMLLSDLQPIVKDLLHKADSE